MVPVRSDLFEALFDATPPGLLVVDSTGAIVRVNQTLGQMAGYLPDQLVGQSVEILFPDLLHTISQDAHQRFLQAPGARLLHQGLNLSGRRQDGQVFPVEIRLTRLTLETSSYTVAFVADISGSRQVEEALRFSEQRFRAIFDNAPLGMMLASQEGYVLEINPAFQQLLGYSTADLRALGPHYFVHPDDFTDALQQNGGPGVRQRRQAGVVRHYLRRNGSAIQVRITASFIQDDAGSQLLLIIAEEVTARLQAEEARARLAAIVDSTDDAIFGVTLDGHIFAWNAAAERLYGYSAAEILGHSRILIVPPDQRAELQRIDAAVVSGQTITHVESIHRHKSGRFIDVALTFSPITDGSGGVIGISTIVRDIGERRRVEQLLMRQATLVRLLQVVAVAANQAITVREALQTAVDAICVGIGWPVGHVYLAQEGTSEPLISTDIWHFDEPERFRAFQAISEALRASATDDLPGRVLLSGQPEWITDFAVHPVRPRFSLISNLGVRCGFAFPVLVGAEVAAVLEFFAAEPQTPDAALLEVMANVGAQLGRVIERDRADQALRKSEQLYRTLAHNLPNGAVLLFDHQLRFGIADGSALAEAGLGREKIEGRTLSEVLSPEAVAYLEPFYRAALRGERHELELVADQRIYLCYFLPVQNERGDILAGMAVTHDITELKHIEHALREERAQLALRVDERTADLSLANAELARAARLKDEFLANMSHELRTPLNSILGRAEALQEGIYGPLTPKQQQVLRGVEESGRHLLSLINDILDLSKIEAGRLVLEIAPLNAGLICHASMQMVTQLALMQRVSLTSNHAHMPDLICADERRLKQILVNLLSNAVKFTPSGGQVGLEVYADAEQQTVTFTVWDTGIGIAAEQLPKLFRPFVQLDSSLSRQYSGTGLGLALVLRLTEAHGGSVRVESMPGQGSRFSIILPWVQELPQNTLCSTESAPERSMLPLRRVLVVEDSVTTVGQLTRYLHETGVEVESQAQGETAVMRAGAWQPDLIILDIMLPDQSGWEVLRALKAEPRTQAIPVVVASVVDEPEQASALGAVAFLRKPINRTLLLETLQHVAQGAAVAPAVLPVTRQRILIAEDNQANIDMLQDYLQEQGYAVVVARNGSEAIAAAHEEPVDIILMDIQMPGMDGLEAIRRLRSQERTAVVPIIALTALAMPGDRERCLEAGANAYLAKPIRLRTLLGMIEEQLNAHAPGGIP